MRYPRHTLHVWHGVNNKVCRVCRVCCRNGTTKPDSGSRIALSLSCSISAMVEGAAPDILDWELFVGDSIGLLGVNCVVTVWYHQYTLHQRTIYEQSTWIFLWFRFFSWSRRPVWDPSKSHLSCHMRHNRDSENTKNAFFLYFSLDCGLLVGS